MTVQHNNHLLLSLKKLNWEKFPSGIFFPLIFRRSIPLREVKKTRTEEGSWRTFKTKSQEAVRYKKITNIWIDNLLLRVPCGQSRWKKYIDDISYLRVGVGSLLSAESGDDVDESAVVLDSPSRSAGLLLLLFLLLDFGGLTLDFSGTGEGTVHFATE